MKFVLNNHEIRFFNGHQLRRIFFCRSTSVIFLSFQQVIHTIFFNSPTPKSPIPPSVVVPETSVNHKIHSHGTSVSQCSLSIHQKVMSTFVQNSIAATHNLHTNEGRQLSQTRKDCSDTLKNHFLPGLSTCQVKVVARGSRFWFKFNDDKNVSLFCCAAFTD